MTCRFFYHRSSAEHYRIVDLFWKTLYADRTEAEPRHTSSRLYGATKQKRYFSISCYSSVFNNIPVTVVSTDVFQNGSWAPFSVYG